MVFNSVVFLFCFLPLSLLLYYLVPGRAKNAVLLAESLIFYCWTGVAFLPLIAVLIVFNYLWALLTARAKAKLRGLLPLAAVLVNLGVLVYFKYANFLIDTVNQVAHLGLAALNIMGLHSPQSAVLSAIIYNALIIVALIPLALKGVSYRPAGAASLLKRNILVYGVGGLIAPFMGIKLIDMVISAWRLV